jgi:hypothetical protein
MFLLRRDEEEVPVLAQRTRWSLANRKRAHAEMFLSRNHFAPTRAHCRNYVDLRLPGPRLSREMDVNKFVPPLSYSAPYYFSKVGFSM